MVVQQEDCSLWNFSAGSLSAVDSLQRPVGGLPLTVNAVLHALGKVSPGDLVVSEKLRDVDVNDRVKLGRVLMLGSRHETVIGRPLIPQASVTAVIEVCACTLPILLHQLHPCR